MDLDARKATLKLNTSRTIKNNPRKLMSIELLGELQTSEFRVDLEERSTLFIATFNLLLYKSYSRDSPTRVE